jgi:hypothetical protein
MNRGLQKKRKLWSVRGRIEFEKLSLEGWAARRKEDLLGLLEQLSRQIGELDEAGHCGRGKSTGPAASLLSLKFSYRTWRLSRGSGRRFCAR